ncbi:uncharacterized protein LOC121888225 isoform X1 [Thunnus maccoyii]|uniref:uncharacterized protein LOC121888225 isoform X1 n=1 Tax=Thunnus maccoyii TaxID=8240 RepID=UPI001C4AAF99|nr:uncharacterized protein LOC121888225 isoform X1 [Thunnus maccoyii]
MEGDEESPTHLPQCPAGSAVGRRNVKVKSEESSNERIEWTVGVKTSKPKISVELSSCVCKDKGSCMCKNGLFDSPSSLCLSPGTTAAQTQMPSPKPKARMLVACRQLIDGSEAASLGDQSHLPLLTLKGAVSLGKASTSAAQQETVIKDPRLNRKLCYNNSEVIINDAKKQYYRDLCQQVEERKQLTERERRRKTTDEQKHNDTMQHSIWGMPGSGAPNYHLGTVRRSKNLYAAGILPQEQIRDKGLRGNPLHHNTPKLRQLGATEQSGKYTPDSGAYELLH